ncbi:MAG: 16S rRNA (cytidine(1402)-2'-O)-methyltransferase [bacterium]|nr:16S rRNA (cytidine(1402)-2'-O)-methyltransferase [bacterium]
MGTLYIVSTPIGNMEDISLRAIRILGEVDIIACEDTRKTGLLMQKLFPLPPPNSSKPIFISYYEENEQQRISEIVNLLGEGKNVALVSNAGTPLISDPGFKLVRECIAQEIKVEAIPGASAVLSALVSSGLPTDKFLFLGFLPVKQGKKKKLLKSLKSIINPSASLRASQQSAISNLTIVFYESPYKLLKTLNEVKDVFGDIEIVICRELTKLHEETIKEKVSETINHFQKTKPQGEFTLLFNMQCKYLNKKMNSK